MRKLRQYRNRAATHSLFIKKLVDQIIEEIVAEEKREAATAK